MTEESRIGSVIASKYRLDEELGRGGMGAVYRAFHQRVHKEFALKMLLGDIARHRSIASRFQLEAQAAGRIGHPGILDVYDVGEDADGTPFIVMELLRGEALATLVRRERIEVDAALWIAIEVLDILEAAHRAGIIHRDVKPQNVFITDGPSGRGVKLLDFGIAKFTAAIDGSALTRSGEIIGSPLYMAPEQAKGEPDVDERVDVWSVGAMLFEMLTGQCAHAATTPVAVLAKILTEPAPPPSARDGRIPAEVDVVVQRALAIDRAARFPSAKAMREALAPLRTGPSVPALPAPVKVSLPPLSTDLTPGAITSTVAMASTPPLSGLETTAAAMPVVAASGGGANVMTTASVTPAAKAKRSALIPLAAAMAVVGAAAYIVKEVARVPPAGSQPAASDPPHASAAPETPVPASASAQAPAAASSEPAVVARPVVDASMVAVPSGPRCAAREHVSHGHCCEPGLEWQNGHCERPIATQF